MFHARKRSVRLRLTLLAVFVAAVSAAVFASTAVQPASAHRSGCHRWHSCPSDHHTYAWGPKRLWCTSYASERLASDRLRVVYQARRYWCHS
jgi:hypothetical protein